MKLPRRSRKNEELDAEINAHLEASIRERMERGATRSEAEASARREFGNIALVRDTTKDIWGTRWLGDFLQDIRYGARQLRRNPGFALVAVLTLALGIGVSTSIFTLADTVLLRPLPYKDPGRLVSVYEGTQGRGVLAWSEFAAFVENARLLEDIAAIQPVTVTVLEGDQPEQVSGALVSASLFSMLGIEPALGRNFLPQEDRPGGEQVALLSEGLWRRAYGTDPAILGKTITLEVNESWGRRVDRSQGYTVVGVLPASFQTLLPGTRGDVWLPLAPTPGNSHDVFVVGRMKPGVAVDAVKADLEAIAGPLGAAMHSDGRDMVFRVTPVIDDLLGDWQRGLAVLLSSVGFVLLIVCVNVANLILARGRARSREMAIRIALGAGRGRLSRQILAETGLLALLGCGLAVLVAEWSIGLLGSLGAGNLPRIGQMQLDARVIAFLGVVTLLTVALAGLLPALRASRVAVGGNLKESGRGPGEGRGNQRLRGFMVVTEVALAVILLIGSALMARTVMNLVRVDPGFSGQNVLSFRIALPRHAYQEAAQRAAFFESLFAQLEQLPGVESAGVNHALPYGGLSTGTRVSRQGSTTTVTALWCAVSPRYFESMRIPLRQGRGFNAAHMQSPSQYAVVDQALARQLWEDQDPVGQALTLVGSNNPPLTVVGVVDTIRNSGLDQQGAPTVYLPIYPRTGGVVVRAASDPNGHVPAIRQILAGLDRMVAPSDIRLMNERVDGWFALQRFLALLLGVFACAAAFLGVVGLYGVVSISVGQRIHEIGVRMALGAQPSDVMRMVLGQAVRLVSVGALLGLIGASALARLMASLLFGVGPLDPLTYAAIPATLGVVALLACYVPARRAASVDPMVALRHE